MVAEYPLYLLGRPMTYFPCAAGQNNRTRCIRDIPRMLILMTRDGLLAVPTCWPQKHTQGIVFQYSVSRTLWSQHNCQPRYSVTRGTNNQVQHSHERPALLLPQVHCIPLLSSDYGLCNSPKSVQSIKLFLASQLLRRLTRLPLVQVLVLKISSKCQHFPNNALLTPIVYYDDAGGNCKIATSQVEIETTNWYDEPDQ
jgi:hypothetical protein